VGRIIAPAATTTLRRLPRNERERIASAIKRLPAGDVRRLTGRHGEWRLRVGDWRLLLRLDRQHICENQGGFMMRPARFELATSRSGGEGREGALAAQSRMGSGITG